MFDRIITVSLNPSLDVTLWIDTFDLEEPNSCKKERIYAGGKALNVTRVLKNLGVPSKLVGLAGGDNQKMLTSLLEADGISYDFLRTGGAVRENMSIILPDGQLLKINRQGEPVKNGICKRLLKTIQGELSPHGKNLVVFAGSIPPNLAPEEYKQLILSVKSQQTAIAVDSDIFTNQDFIDLSPFIIKPNCHEAKKLLGNPEMDNREMFERMKELSCHIGHILLSMGKDGLLYFHKGRYWRIHAPHVEVKSTIGAGDTTLAGFIASLFKGIKPLSAVCYAAACGTASVELEGTEAISPGMADRYLKKTIAEEIY